MESPSAERLGDLESERVHAAGIRHVGCDGNRETAIRERQERDTAAPGTASVTDDPRRLAGKLDTPDGPAQRIGRGCSRHEARGRLERGDRVCLQ